MDTLDTVANALQWVGTIFLGVMVIFYIVPPIKHHILGRTPPAILSLTYGALTAATLVLGIRIIHDHSIHQSFEQYATQIFTAGQVPPRTMLLLIATFASLFFILGNLVRSYFNLHRIDDAAADDTFATFIGSLVGTSRAFELLLRILMVVTILAIEAMLLEIRAGVATSVPAPRATLVVDIFHRIWHAAFLFYVWLLVWDTFLLLRLPAGPTHKSVKAVLLRQALPVHLCGLGITTLMAASSYGPLINLTDLLAILASFVAAVGVVLLLLSGKFVQPTGTAAGLESGASS